MKVANYSVTIKIKHIIFLSENLASSKELKEVSHSDADRIYQVKKHQRNFGLESGKTCWVKQLCMALVNQRISLSLSFH